ncbi:GerAB/ArcD/ProY family transporter [Cohnella hongkongensis]|uniref:Endospore germination permease n=1 Tax=Cohnella hongkongensis TaxID=178337 RepID=A0ABV9F5Q2_9BACL
MERSTVISNFQLMALIIISTIGTSSLYAPATLVRYAERNTWFLVLAGGLVGLLNVSVFLTLNRLYPDKNLVRICKHLLGPWIGGLLAVVFVFYFIDITAWVLREFAHFFIIALNPDIPQSGYLLTGIVMGAYAVFRGLEAFSRVSEIILFVVVASFMGIYVSLVWQYHPEYLLPVLENGWLEPLSGIVPVASWLGDLMFISMILNHVRRTKKTPMYAFGAVAVTTVLLLLSVLSCTMLFGAKTSETFTYPSVSLIQNIRLFRHIERFDAALVAVWVMSSFIKLTVYLWSAQQGLADLLKLGRPRLFLIPMAAGIYVCARFKVWGMVELGDFYDKQAWYFCLFQLVIPVGLLLIAWMRGDGGEPKVSA